MRRVRRLAVVVLSALGLGYLLVCALLFAGQRSILFPAPVELLSVNDGSRRVEVPGGTFFLWRAGRDEGPVVVHFHANGDQVGNLSWLGQSWARAGASFAAVEYPGYPGAEGTPSESSMLAAAEAALQHLTGAMKIDRARIVLSGQSLGTGVALAMAARGWGVRLVLISPYTSWPAVAGHAFPLLPTGLLVLDRFDAAPQCGQVKVPTLVVHGTRDTIVPFTQGEAVCAAIASARLMRVEGAHHHDVLDSSSVVAAMVAFGSERAP